MLPQWITVPNWDNQIYMDVSLATSHVNSQLLTMYESGALHTGFKGLLLRSLFELVQAKWKPASFCLFMLDFSCFVNDDNLAIQVGSLLVKLWPSLSVRDRIFIVYRINAMITHHSHDSNQIIIRRLGATVALSLLKSVINLIKENPGNYRAKYTSLENQQLFDPYFEAWSRLLTREEYDHGVIQRGRQIANLSVKTRTELLIWETQQHVKRDSKLTLISQVPQASL